MEENINIVIRQIRPEDYNEVYNLIETAFKTAEHKDGDEQDFAVGLRNGENYIPELDLVAEIDGKLVGHIMFTKTFVTLPNGEKFNTLLVAPLAVLLEYRNLHIGSKLMTEGLNRAFKLGYTTAFLIGDPLYYKRFGFKLSHLYDINHVSMPAEYVQACEMVPDALKGITGIIEM